MSNQVKLDSVSIKVANFMCFGNEPQGFDTVRPINLIIGRNNAGKTTLIEMLQYWTGQIGGVPKHLWHGSVSPELHLGQKLTAELIQRVYPPSTSGGNIPGPSWWEYGNKFIGHTAKLVVNCAHENVAATLPDNMVVPTNNDSRNLVGNFIKGRRLLRLSSERDINPEHKNTHVGLRKNGDGATRILYELINTATYAKAPETEFFLGELNKITKPDLEFTAIAIKEGVNEKWEVFLTEIGKEPIPLSSLGSGLKTIILVLLLLHIIPMIDQEIKAVEKSELLFAFEEIENYLHPAIQRRLLAYIRNYALTTGAAIFITSHSNVSIDMFSKDGDAQIVHVTSHGKTSKAELATTYIQHKNILDDLDVRASDLLQSNGVIWVEGPSDRVYLNHWIKLWSDGKLSEGSHYQIVFYGGRMLSHLSSALPEECDSLISILRVNKNAAIVIDSDRRADTNKINSTKSRLVLEVEAMQGVAWVTNGREIENYIPLSVVNKIYSENEGAAPDKYSSFFDFLNTVEQGEGDRCRNSKPVFAEKVTEEFEKGDIANSLDLQDRLEDVCLLIRKWNNIE